MSRVCERHQDSAMSDDEMEVGRAIAEDNLNEKTRKKYKRGANGFAKYVMKSNRSSVICLELSWNGEPFAVGWCARGKTLLVLLGTICGRNCMFLASMPHDMRIVMCVAVCHAIYLRFLPSR